MHKMAASLTPGLESDNICKIWKWKKKKSIINFFFFLNHTLQIVENSRIIQQNDKVTGGRIARWRGSSVEAKSAIAEVTVRANSSLTLQLLWFQA